MVKNRKNPIFCGKYFQNFIWNLRLVLKLMDVEIGLYLIFGNYWNKINRN